MLNAAMVLMILAGIFGLPAVACSGACAALSQVPGDPAADAGGKIMVALMWLGIIASAGSIVVGALVRRLGKVVAGTGALLFMFLFVALLIQANTAGLTSALMLLIAAVMIFVSPEEQFRRVTRVEQA